MDKLQMQSKNLVDENIEFIAKRFPNCVTEALDEEGKLTKLVDFDMLKQELSHVVIDGDKERYTMTWPDKKQAILTANAPIAKTLRPCREESVDFDHTQNLYIEGDNLDVLKLLRETYLGKIKMIYIDPPYNTGNDFVYNDDFAVDTEEYLERSNQVDEQGNRMVANNDSNGRFHTDWLNMIYPRLKLAKDLLTDDGVIFISIGEQEVDNLKKICTEIFGNLNFIENYIWESTFRPDNSSKIMRRNAEYVMCIAKNLNSISQFIGEIKDKEGLPSLTKSNMKESTLVFPANTVKTYLQNGIYKAGVKDSYELLDDVVVSNGIIENQFRLKGHMIWGQSNLDKEILLGTEIIIKSAGFVPYTKKAGDSIMSPTKIIPSHLVGDILSANAEMSKLFDKKVFSYPKPVSLLKYLIKYIPENDFTILDFFSGSSTTAQAVMELNTIDGGNRKFIMVQLPENLDENYKKCSDKERVIVQSAIDLCDSLGKSHYLTEVAKERIRRAGKKIKEEIEKSSLIFGKNTKKPLEPTVETKLALQMTYEKIDDPNDRFEQLVDKKIPDIGFRCLKLDSSCMKDIYYSPNKTTQDLLTQFEDNIKENRTPEDLLFQVMLDMGVMLSSKIIAKRMALVNGKYDFIDDAQLNKLVEKEKQQLKTIFVVGDCSDDDQPDLICCFDKDLNDDIVTAIAKMQPLYAVFRDASMSTDSVAVNFDQIFETYSPTTTRKII